MINYKAGGITNMAGDYKDIVVSAKAPNKLKDALIGGGLVLTGIAYLTYTAFRHGARAFEKAEFDTQYKLGILKEPINFD